jgi:hypothetical protein
MFRDIKTKEQAQEAASSIRLKNSSFGNCPTMAEKCYGNFKKALLAEKT